MLSCEVDDCKPLVPPYHITIYVAGSEAGRVVVVSAPRYSGVS